VDGHVSGTVIGGPGSRRDPGPAPLAHLALEHETVPYGDCAPGGGCLPACEVCELDDLRRALDAIAATQHEQRWDSASLSSICLPTCRPCAARAARESR
jgi:hypothetical protein